MFNFLMHTRKPVQYLTVFLLIVVGISISLLMKIYIGGYFIISAVVSSLVLPKRHNLPLLVLLFFISHYLNLANGIPAQAVVLRQATFFVTLSFAAICGIELKKYINRCVERQRQVSSFNKDLILAFVDTMEAKDDYLRGHSLNVSFYAKLIAEKMGLPREMRKKISLAGIFHDIGKIGISDSILNKESKLTDEEWDILQQHPLTGTNILSKISALDDLVDIITYHHRHYNGNGYPSGPEKENIPLGARIIAVADAFDAMTSNRSYRQAMSIEAAKQELIRCSGTQFDPKVVAAFLKCRLFQPSKEEFRDTFSRSLDFTDLVNSRIYANARAK